MTKAVLFAVLAGLASPALAQTDSDAESRTRVYIDNAFGRMDANKDGHVDQAEFGVFMTARLAQQKARFDAEFNAADSNGDGKIDKSEATAANPVLAERFATIDANADGFVTPEEIRAAILSAQASELPEN